GRSAAYRAPHDCHAKATRTAETAGQGLIQGCVRVNSGPPLRGDRWRVVVAVAATTRQRSPLPDSSPVDATLVGAGEQPAPVRARSERDDVEVLQPAGDVHPGVPAVGTAQDPSAALDQAVRAVRPGRGVPDVRIAR